MSKRIFQATLAVFAAYGIYSAFVNFAVLNRAGYFPPGLVRLRILELQSGRAPADATLAAAGLLHDGCPANASAQAVRLDGTYILGSTAEKPANGYFFVSNGTSSDVPTRWIVDWCAGNSSTWVPVSASVWRFNSDGSVSLYPELPNGTPLSAPGAATEERMQLEIGTTGTGIEVDASPPLSWALTACTTNIYYSLALFCCSAAGLLGRVGWIPFLWLSLLAVDTAFTSLGIAAIAYAEPWNWREAAQMCMYLPSVLFLAFGSAFCERQFITVLLLSCILALASYTVSGVVLYRRDPSEVLLEQAKIITINSVGLVFCIVALAFRKHALRRAQMLVLDDRCRYDCAWDALRADTEADAALQSVRDGAARMASRVGNSLTQRQIQHPATRQQHFNGQQTWANSASDLLARCAGQRSFYDRTLPIRSLDQLFVQAVCLDPILRSKVQKWALQSRGCFTTRRMNGTLACMRFEQLQHDDNVGAIRWSNVKSSHRAIEKLVRGYEQVGGARVRNL